MTTSTHRRTTWIVALSLVLALVLATGGYVWWSRWRLDQGLAAIKRVEAFPGREAGPVTPEGPRTFLLVGSGCTSQHDRDEGDRWDEFRARAG